MSNIQEIIMVGVNPNEEVTLHNNSQPIILDPNMIRTGQDEEKRAGLLLE
jgi:hypothetical protein